MSVKFCPIASGSSGNSVYIGNEDTHILIDAGISGKKIEAGLITAGVLAENLSAIFITHEHTDHIQGAGVLSRRYDVPIYATEKTWKHIDYNHSIGTVKQKNKMVIYSGEKCVINDIQVTPFDIPHDATEPVGYPVFMENFKLTVATDIGCVTDCLKENILDSDILLIESNHDIEMLKNGPYTYHLKKRVLSDVGHLSNVSTGHLLSEIITNKLKYIYLGHLSEQNNRPRLAYDTVLNILQSKKIDTSKTKLMLASRGIASETLKLA